MIAINIGVVTVQLPFQVILYNYIYSKVHSKRHFDFSVISHAFLQIKAELSELRSAQQKGSADNILYVELYGEVNSVKNTTINIWLNDGVYYQWKKNYMFRPTAAIFRF